MRRITRKRWAWSRTRSCLVGHRKWDGSGATLPSIWAVGMRSVARRTETIGTARTGSGVIVVVGQVDGDVDRAGVAEDGIVVPADETVMIETIESLAEVEVVEAVEEEEDEADRVVEIGMTGSQGSAQVAAQSRGAEVVVNREEEVVVSRGEDANDEKYIFKVVFSIYANKSRKNKDQCIWYRNIYVVK